MIYDGYVWILLGSDTTPGHKRWAKLGQAGPHLPVLRLAGRPLREFTSTDTCRDLRCRLEGAAAGSMGDMGMGQNP